MFAAAFDLPADFELFAALPAALRLVEPFAVLLFLLVIVPIS
jgi:hypothetical protein